MTAWAFATLAIQDESLMASISRRALQDGFLVSFNSRDIAMTAWAFASLRIWDEALLAAIVQRMEDDEFLRTFNAQDLATTVKAFTAFAVDYQVTGTVIARWSAWRSGRVSA